MHPLQHPARPRQLYGPGNHRLPRRVNWTPGLFRPLIPEEHPRVQPEDISRLKRHSKSHSRLSGIVAGDRTGSRRREDSSSAGHVHSDFQEVHPADVRHREAGSHVGRKKEGRSMENSSVGGKSAGGVRVSVLYTRPEGIYPEAK